MMQLLNVTFVGPTLTIILQFVCSWGNMDRRGNSDENELIFQLGLVSKEVESMKKKVLCLLLLLPVFLSC